MKNINYYFEKPEKPTPEEIVGILAFILIIFLTMNTPISMMGGLISGGITHIFYKKYSRKK